MNDTVPGPTVRTGLNYMQFLLIILQVKYWQFHMTQADTMCSSKEEWCINYPQLKMRKLRLVEVSEWPRPPSYQVVGPSLDHPVWVPSATLQ